VRVVSLYQYPETKHQLGDSFVDEKILCYHGPVIYEAKVSNWEFWTFEIRLIQTAVSNDFNCFITHWSYAEPVGEHHR